MGNIKLPTTDSSEAGEVGRAVRIIDGDSFVMELESGGELSVRLSAIQAPRTAQRAARAWPYAYESRAALSALIKNRQVKLFYGCLLYTSPSPRD